MSVLSARITVLSILLSASTLISCSHPAAVTADPADFHWSAAKSAYAAGDYLKSADHLEPLIKEQNKYTTLAIPWYLVLTSGMAAGYMDLADQYAAGAHMNKSDAAAFRLKASAYRTTAGGLALRFAENVDKFAQVPLGSLRIAFPLPHGDAMEPALLSRIAAGIVLIPADSDRAEVLSIQHAVLMAVCRATGAPNDVARTEEILGQVAPWVPRATFGQAIAQMLNADSALYGRNELDEPSKLAAFRERAQAAGKEAGRAGSAKIVQAASAVSPKSLH